MFRRDAMRCVSIQTLQEHLPFLIPLLRGGSRRLTGWILVFLFHFRAGENESYISFAIKYYLYLIFITNIVPEKINVNRFANIMGQSVRIIP